MNIRILYKFLLRFYCFRYNLVLFFVTYVLPMAAMVGCYSAMGRELWGSRAIGVLTQRQVDSIKSKRKVIYSFI